MNLDILRERRRVLPDAIVACLMTARSIVRGLPLFVAARPRTPLRVLCIMAFDTLHRLRDSKPLPEARVRLLAAFLDFGACANATFDHKPWCREEFDATLRLLEEGGHGALAIEYLQRLRELEQGRPRAGGDRLFPSVRSYREGVVRLSLGMVAATARGTRCLDEGIRAVGDDGDLDLLFRVVMQCQIIDDVLDYSQDLSAGLPSFLTAAPSLSESLRSTRQAALAYADVRDLPRIASSFPQRLALQLVSVCTKLILALARGQWMLNEDDLRSLTLPARLRVQSKIQNRKSKMKKPLRRVSVEEAFV